MMFREWTGPQCAAHDEAQASDVCRQAPLDAVSTVLKPIAGWAEPEWPCLANTFCSPSDSSR